MADPGPWWARNDPSYQATAGPDEAIANSAGLVVSRLPTGEGRVVGEVCRRRRSAALLASVVVHAVVLVGLLLHPAKAPFGTAGPDLGTGMPVTLVAGFSEGGVEAGPRVDPAPEVEAERDALQPEETPLDTGAKVPDIPQPRKDRQATAPPASLAMARAEDGEAANVFDGITSASGATGGDPTATSDLLAQVARCLPPDFRPRLGFSQLTLSIGPEGRLSAAPSLISGIPQVSAEHRAAADRIVQAALLCGPYAHPDAVNRTISLAADFSAIGPKGGSATR